MVYGPRREALRLGPGGAYAEERDEGRLGERRVLAGRLAQLGGGRGGVQHVVVDLEREADVRAVAAQRLARCGRSPGREAADHRRRGDESARLASVHVRELAHGEAPPLGLQVERLPANHAARPRRTSSLSMLGRSSCTSEYACTTSTAAASAPRPSAGAPGAPGGPSPAPPAASAAANTRVGRNRLPAESRL